jgi:hypothetical protein
LRWPATEGYGLKRASEANELGVEREREQLRRELHALNYHLILGISPPVTARTGMHD